MTFSIPYDKLQLIPYEGAGNRTPVLNIGAILSIEKFHPEDVREWLEKDNTFRTFLHLEGKKLNADTIMLYYAVSKRPYEFVTFIAEPNAPIMHPFSDMCGNGIRCLAYHIVSSETDPVLKQQYLEKGISVWAGIPRTICIESLAANSAMVRVDLGTFHTDISSLARYCTIAAHQKISSYDDFKIPDLLVPALQEKRFGLGFNGDAQSGEPHLVLMQTEQEFLDLYQSLFHLFPALEEKDTYITALRRVICEIGPSLTFNTALFPRGVNVNLGVVKEDSIFMTTHERNLSTSSKECAEQIKKSSSCRCNTLACGTGGSAVSTIAYLQHLLSSPSLTTIQPGGNIRYEIQKSNTVMIGPARRIVEEAFITGEKQL